MVKNTQKTLQINRLCGTVPSKIEKRGMAFNVNIQ
jgi:hypothetical protein